jgi:hypothetical protein
VSGFPLANRREARKLGLLRTQKFRRFTRASGAAGANERVCGECPTPINIQRPNSDLNNAKYSDGMMAAAYALCPSMHTDKKLNGRAVKSAVRLCPVFSLNFF